MLSRCTRGLSCILIRSTPQAVGDWEGFSKPMKASASGPRGPRSPRARRGTRGTALRAAALARAAAPARWDRNARDSLEHK